MINMGDQLFSALKVEKKAGEKVDYNKMKVKQLKAILGKLKS